MSDPTMTGPLAKCPVCNRTHTEPIEEALFDVSYCPFCGVPNFFTEGRFNGGMVKCCRCRELFDPRKGGGNIVEFFTEFETVARKNPSGLRRIALRRPQ